MYLRKKAESWDAGWLQSLHGRSAYATRCRGSRLKVEARTAVHEVESF